jgi:6-phosphofructokinase 1
MNAAVRAVVRTALNRGVEVSAIFEGYQGLVDGGDRIQRMSWGSVGGILFRGGTVIGTARCSDFRTAAGRRQAVLNLLGHDIGGLVIIGGDGSLTGASLLHREWPRLTAELVQQGQAAAEVTARHPNLAIVGLVGSIDNDVFGSDMTIGADSALHRITAAVDAISSTADSHQRTFVVEVMGRKCGYLALMGALASGADWVLIPESPPDLDNWEDKMCQVLKMGRDAGRRDSIVIVAEGAQDRHGKPLTSAYVKQVLEEQLKEEVRVTILGHVQRGGSPSAFDRNVSTLMGHAAVDEILSSTAKNEPVLVGIRGNRIVRSPLLDCVSQTQAVSKALAVNDYQRALELRGSKFQQAFRTLRTLVRAFPHQPEPGQKQLRLAVLHGGGPAPGMNTAVRAAARVGVDQGHTIVGVSHGFEGLIEGGHNLRELHWMDVNGWATMGGAELGTNRKIPTDSELYAIARNLEEQKIEGLLMIGGWAGYRATHQLYSQRHIFPAFNIPLVCLPASINNNLPGSELSIGADTALNSIVGAVDRIKQSAVASRRCFVVEVMGRYCGYLALMSGLATGAERVYLNEEGVTLRDLEEDLNRMVAGFRQGKRLALMIRNEQANLLYSTSFMCALFEEEGRDLFDVRQAILGHIQQGGDPSPFDRIQATQLAARCIDFLADQAGQSPPAGAFIGLQAGEIRFGGLEDLPRLMDENRQRPKEQWWMALRAIARELG